MSSESDVYEKNNGMESRQSSIMGCKSVTRVAATKHAHKKNGSNLDNSPKNEKTSQDMTGNADRSFKC